MARLLDLPGVLRAAGLAVLEYPGWAARGLDSFGPLQGITCHETQGSWTSTDDGELRTIAITGSTSARAPIAQLYVGRDARWWVVASGTCNHNKVGWAGPNKHLGNDALLGIEAQHGKGEPWTGLQYRSYVAGVAALCRAYGIPVTRVAGHKEHQPGEKTDPGFDMDTFRANVANALARNWMEATAMGMMFLARDAKTGQHWLCDGMVMRPIPAELVDDVQYLGKVGAISLWSGTTPHEAPKSIWGNISPAMGVPLGGPVDVDEKALAAELVPLLPTAAAIAGEVGDLQAQAARAAADVLDGDEGK